ncbi:MAG: tryptophanase [Chlamydiales bacterium]|jgi:tryptophanase|nr:tryptophanase [Chlamydiales bacterium]
MLPQTCVEPYAIKMVEHIKNSNLEDRSKWIEEANYNLFRLKSDQVFIDLLTDSGTTAMSDQQWAKMILATESYAGSNAYYELQNVVHSIFQMPYFLPAHQGRAAEHILFSVLVNNGDLIPGNTHFDTTKGLIECRGGQVIDCTIKEGFDPTENHPFKGNIDLDVLEEHLKIHSSKIPFILLTITCNSIGGHPVSMENIRRTSELCSKYEKLLFFDAARFAENAYFIKTREACYQHKSIPEIIGEMFAYVDGFMMSGKKDGLVNMGGLIGLKNEQIFQQACIFTARYEGFLTYGGLAARDLAALAQGLVESTDFYYLESRIEQVAYLGKQLKLFGIPIYEPFGGHAIFIDAKKVYPHIAPSEYPAQVLAIELYRKSGIRSVGIGTLMLDRDAATQEERFSKVELVRLAIPRRRYTYSHLNYISEAVKTTYNCASMVKRGFKITKETPILRYCNVELSPISY